VDLTEDTDEEMLQAPATPPPHVSGDEGDVPMEEEDQLLGRTDNNDSGSDEDGFQHV